MFAGAFPKSEQHHSHLIPNGLKVLRKAWNLGHGFASLQRGSPRHLACRLSLGCFWEDAG